MSPRLRSVVVLLVGGVALAFAANVIAPGFRMPLDFLEYWSAGRVNLRGGNPYHPDELLAEQRVADPDRTNAVMMWNPPPALAVYMPLGLLSPQLAALLWVGLQLAAVFVACDLLWRTYCPTHRWFSPLVAVSFVGTWWLVEYGQNTGLLQLGLAGFLHFAQKEKPLTAGAFAALTALKPHLLAVFGVLLVANAIRRGGAKALGAGVAVIALALGAVLLTNPHAVAQFVEATRHPAEGAVKLSDWWLPTPAFWIRHRYAPAHFWVQFVPCAVACAAFLLYRLRKGSAWDWSRALPLVVAVSVLTTPYGGWIFDLPVLLVPVVWAAARLVRAKKWLLAFALVFGQAAITAMTFSLPQALGRPVGLHDFGWVAPAALVLCLLALAGKEEPQMTQKDAD